MAGKECRLEPILFCIGAAREGAADCDPTLLQDFLTFFAGFVPDTVENRVILVVVCGLALLDQHPDLAQVRFLSKLRSQDEFASWIEEQRALFGETRWVISIEDAELSHLRGRAHVVAERLLRKWNLL